MLNRFGFIVSGGNTIGMYNFFAQWGERDTAYVSRASRLAAPGWDAVDIVFGEEVPARMMRELERDMRDSYRFRYFTVTRVGGRRVWIMTLQRILKLSGVSGGAAPEPPTPPAIDNTWLNFTMPEGGVVTLIKAGFPTAVTLEYSLDNGRTWTEWIEEADLRSLTLNAGQTMHVRNASHVQTNFSGRPDTYRFSFYNIVYVGGNLNSLLCSIPENVTTLSRDCFSHLFYNCTSLTLSDGFILPATTLAIRSYEYMFYGCTSLNTMRTLMTNISASNCLTGWLDGVAATGDFYCPSTLTIPTGPNGIPAGWIRHDI